MTVRRDAPLIERLMPLALTLGVIVIALVGGYVFVRTRSPVLWRRTVRPDTDDA